MPKKFVTATRKLPPSRNNHLRADIFRLGFVLLFCCGLRSGELRRLTLGNIDVDQSLIHIENTKFQRHSFAANVLQRWYAEGTDVQARLPHLATYLGHADVPVRITICN
jgi:hypothetical protein